MFIHSQTFFTGNVKSLVHSSNFIRFFHLPFQNKILCELELPMNCLHYDQKLIIASTSYEGSVPIIGQLQIGSKSL